MDTKIKNKKGFTIVELMVSIFLFLSLGAGSYMAFHAGYSSWKLTEAQIQIEDPLRLAVNKISRELQESAPTQILITQEAQTTSLRFSIPIICQSGANLLDATGAVANWGAALTWGCSATCDPNIGCVGNCCSLTCMDLDDSCATNEFDKNRYRRDPINNQLIREVINEGTGIVSRTDIIAENVTFFSVFANADTTVLDATITIENDKYGRHLESTRNFQIYIRNRE